MPQKLQVIFCYPPGNLHSVEAAVDYCAFLLKKSTIHSIIIPTIQINISLSYKAGTCLKLGNIHFKFNYFREPNILSNLICVVHIMFSVELESS